MSQRDRYEFVALATAEGLPLATCRRLMRYAATLHRLAEQECNGQAWLDGRLVACPNAGQPGEWCEWCAAKGGEHGRVSSDAIAVVRWRSVVKRLLVGTGTTPVFGGDPRGAALILKVPSGATNDWGRQGIVVP